MSVNGKVLGEKRQAQGACAACGKYGVLLHELCPLCGLPNNPVVVEAAKEPVAAKAVRKPKGFWRPEVVEVEWLDSMGYSGWNNMDDRIEHLDKVESMDHVSVGYVIKRTPRYVSVTLSMSRAGQIGDTIQIPRQAIKRITVLRKATNS